MTLTGMNPLSVRYVSTVDLPESLVPMIAINILVDGQISGLRLKSGFDIIITALPMRKA